MAGAEARALWQRTANRCFVQEDAKRAPKLACCQSSPAASKSVDAEPSSAAGELDHVNVSVTPLDQKSSLSNLSPDLRWWLHSQPNYGYQKSSTNENLNASLEDELEALKAIDGSKTSKGEVTHFSDEDCDLSYYMNCDFHTDAMKKTPKDRMQEAYSENFQAFSEVEDINHVDCLVSKQTDDSCLGPDYSWIEGDKTEPWWRTTDRDELASFVSQKSLNHFENCDLPPPQKKFLRRHPCSDISNDKITTTSFDCEAHVRRSLNSELMHGNRGPSAKEEISSVATSKSSCYCAIHKDTTKNQHILEGDLSKAELMEALHHSQKRAREAEEAARQAYAEKEDIVKLLFKQASQIFAYKQWFQLLQLENLYVQIKNKDQPVSTLFPMPLPRIPCEGRKPRKRKHKFSRDNQGRQDWLKTDITTYAVAFALGLSLVGAGLLLGWTVGWMLPRF